ncbi:hypothetical protein E2562_025281 [Oryza meyeriana var. granulata]|uniref:Protein FAR1-RELATED SEQUENCE n=1 Tax=Oryza meyeriana var. granulata TaxID=110450 RepID=A0A6G1BQ43_9ORYZ|nr:hypothetical protein E2562_025281 [Oryza meyeriana var. granulata]
MDETMMEFIDTMQENRVARNNIVDQDTAMAATIPRIFPNIIHRLCKWHILHKHADALNILFMHNKNLEDDLMLCID